MISILQYAIILFLSSTLCAQKVSFDNVAENFGITHSIVTQMFGGGVSFCDFDNDGLEDISLTTEFGKSLSIYNNETIIFSEVTDLLGIHDSSEIRTILWADYDNDDDKDLFIATFADQNRLYKNDGMGSFTDVTDQSGMPLEVSPSTAAAWADYDNDGWIDLYVGNYELNGKSFANYLFRNNGDGTFSDVALQVGAVDTIGGTNLQKLPLALSFLDFNNDGWSDIYIANDKRQGNTLFKNNGNGSFSDVSSSSGADLKFDAMGVTVGDYNNDGFMDIYVTNGPMGNGLLMNNADETFTNIAVDLGLMVNKVCWGANFIDIDNDTDLDLFISASWGPSGMQDPQRQNALFENMGDGTFTQLFLPGINTDTSKSYGNAIGDFNNDGYCDIVVLNAFPTYSALWKNSGFSNNWIKLQLQGVRSNMDGIGSTIKVYLGSTSFIRAVNCGSSYLSQNSAIQTIGVGSVTIIDSIIINWPSGSVDVMRNVNANSFYLVEECSTVTTIKGETTALSSYKLHQNYPNPFNPSTKIKFSLAADSKVTLKVFGILGQEVANLISGNLPAGSHEFIFNASNINSGVYFYRIDAIGVDGTNFLSIKKMILMK